MKVFLKAILWTSILALSSHGYAQDAQHAKPNIKALKNRIIQKTLHEQNLKTQDIKPAQPQPAFVTPQQIQQASRSQEQIGNTDQMVNPTIHAPIIQSNDIATQQNSTVQAIQSSQTSSSPSNTAIHSTVTAATITTTASPSEQAQKTKLPTDIHQAMNLKSPLSFPSLELDSFLKNPLTNQIHKALDQWKLSWDGVSYRFECRWELLGNMKNINQNFTSQLIQSRWWYILGGKPKSPIIDQNRGELAWEFHWKDEQAGILNHYLTLVYQSKKPLSELQKQKLSAYLPESLIAQPSGTIEQNRE